uniref:Uncharacterized protein n=1 Tax=Chenopodium quinoa TaxID=63459 RepID=A0A803NA01_CHEQI
MAGVGPMSQDWEPVVIRKKTPTPPPRRTRRPSTPPVVPAPKSKLFAKRLLGLTKLHPVAHL